MSWSSVCKSNVINPGDSVRILYPDYVAGKTGTVLVAETLRDGSQSDYWLVQIGQTDDVILALLPNEMEPLNTL